MTHKGTVTLETERLVLRRFEQDDAEAVFRNWAKDSEVTKYLMWLPHENVSASKDWCEQNANSYANDKYYSWVIVPKALSEPIGSIGVVKLDEKTSMTHIGYCIGKAWWRQGYTSEALKAVVKFLFEEVGVNRIESRHDPRNPNSGKVMEKAGLKYEGSQRQADWNNQGICDASYYAILAEDYFGKAQERSVTIGDISIDCSDPMRTRDFYASLTGWEKREAYGCPALVGDNGLLLLFMGCDFEFVPPVWPEEPGKQQKQMHFNFQVDDLPSAVKEALLYGATKAAAQYGEEHFITMLDPEGHPFCLCARKDESNLQTSIG